MKKGYWLRSFLPGVLLILMGFLVGTHSNILFALVGFLSFFVVGITLMVEGRKK